MLRRGFAFVRPAIHRTNCRKQRPRSMDCGVHVLWWAEAYTRDTTEFWAVEHTMDMIAYRMEVALRFIHSRGWNAQPRASPLPSMPSPLHDAPSTDAPTTDAPAADATISDSPTTDSPTTDAPTTDAPSTNPSTDPALLALVVYSPPPF